MLSGRGFTKYEDTAQPHAWGVGTPSQLVLLRVAGVSRSKLPPVLGQPVSIFQLMVGLDK